MKQKVEKKAARWLVLGKRYERCSDEEDAITTKDDSGSAGTDGDEFA